ncbi:MAG: endonuclease MutS2 [Bacillota bacterium]|nr:endonuclease MutS2 [Bacillota bacterium]
MNQKAYRVLEYNKIKELLRQEASSSLTGSRIQELRPRTEAREIRELTAETTEAVAVIMAKGALPLGGFYDVAGWAHLAQKGGCLTMKQLLEILYNLQAARHAARFLQNDLPELPIIKGLAEVISIQRSLEEEIDRCILSEEEMADGASGQLRDIRRRIGRQNENIRSRLNSILGSSENRTLLQDAIVTMRQGRYVIPVKQEHRNRFPGIVHDQSATGATLFIEPQAIVNMNNELRELELAEKQEMQRILEELSGQVAQGADGIINNQKILVELDYIFAKGKLSVKMKGAPAAVNAGGYLRIRNGRHPLIDPEKVVPVSVSLGREYRTLVVTGPNTGGKTVTLKTVGLFALMAQSGLHLPAGDGTEMPVFSKVFADIGDEQSIEQSLSTFSSHMGNIVEILQEADGDTLVLLDELGAGTDPTEGAALAISILEHLNRLGAATMATTHYTELKKYAVATPGVENASMEFNVETLSPTYRLSIGAPGRSNAFEISRKLGLREDIIERAKGHLDREDIAFEDVISSIEEDRRTAEEERDEAIALNLEMKKRREALERQEEKLAAQKERILEKAREEAKELIRETKELADQVQRELRELEKYGDPRERNRKQEALRKQIREVSGRYRPEPAATENLHPVDPGQLKVGDRVRILSLDQKGRVLSLPDERGELTIQAGKVKINAKLENVSKIEGNPSGEKGKGQGQHSGSLSRGKVLSVSPTFNVVGRVLDDALMEVDKYLDDAFVAGLKEVTVIHGRGAGILREGLQNMFRSHKHVDGWRKGAYNEGGDGVTVVKLK